MGQRNKAPSADEKPVASRIPRAILPDKDLKTSQSPFKWSLQLADREGRWGFNDKVFADSWCGDILLKLQALEMKTWAIIANDSSGKSKGKGTRNHHIAVHDLSKNARKRLKKIKLDDLDQLFSLRINGKKRLFGIVENHVMKLLWYDPRHEVCPTKR